MRKNKERINTEPAAEPMGPNPFAGLDPTALPNQPPPATTNLANTGKPESASGDRVEIRREKSGRGGKTVTTLRGFANTSKEDRETLLRDLKKQTGTGGALLPDGLLLQGDCRDAVENVLKSAGYQAVRAGG